MSFKYIQPFFLDSAAVGSAPETGITRIDLYFRGKPKASGNKSGILNPGVEVSIVPITNGIPNISETTTIRPTEPTEHGARFAPRYEIARAEWGQIVATPDASIATPFIFSNPMFVKTRGEYGILIKYDGNEDFVLWYNKNGEYLIGTTTASPGASDRNVEDLFNYIGPDNIDVDNLTPQTQAGQIATQSNANIPATTPDPAFLQSNWKSLSGTQLKFKVYVSRYFVNGIAVAANTTLASNSGYAPRFSTDNIPFISSPGVTRMTAPVQPQEFIRYQIKDSVLNSLIAGDKVYQTAPAYPGGRATPLQISTAVANVYISANGSYIMPGGNTFAASNGFNAIFGKANTEYIIVDNGANVTSVYQVVSVVNSTFIQIDRPGDFTNSVANFMLAPVGKVAGIQASYIDGAESDVLVLLDSTANSTVRFVNNTILTCNVNTGGSGYANSDYVEISGFETVSNKVVGGYKAKANLVTNSTGGVTAMYMSNNGCGFVNTAWIAGANVVIKNANNANSSGSSLTFTPKIGANLKCENDSSTFFGNCEVINLEATRLKPEITVNNPVGTAFNITHQQLFYSKSDTATVKGKSYFIYDNPAVTQIPVKIFKSHTTGSEENVASTMPSRSNQFVIPYANGSFGNTSIIGQVGSNAGVYFFDISSNNDFVCPFFEPGIIHAHYSKYVINNDYTNEHTNYGNAYAKHVATKITFNTDRQAEDALIYLTAYRPVGTDLKVYTRIHNRTDQDAFDDLDWTLLECIDGDDVYSSATDETDYKEYTYNFVKTPNTDLNLTGTVSVANNTTTIITGSGTAFDTELAANDIVKIYQPLFEANSVAVCAVASVTNSTQFIIQTPIANVGLVGDGLNIERIRDFKHQAYNDILNSNIVSYFNEEMVQFDTYDTLQVKVIFLSNNEAIVPKIDDIRGAGVTA